MTKRMPPELLPRPESPLVLTVKCCLNSLRWPRILPTIFCRMENVLMNVRFWSSKPRKRVCCVKFCPATSPDGHFFRKHSKKLFCDTLPFSFYLLQTPSRSCWPPPTAKKEKLLIDRLFKSASEKPLTTSVARS